MDARSGIGRLMALHSPKGRVDSAALLTHHGRVQLLLPQIDPLWSLFADRRRTGLAKVDAPDWKGFDAVERHEIDQELRDLDRWIVKAGTSLLTFYQRTGTQVFRRANLTEQSDDTKYRTSTSRAFLALFEYLRWLHEESTGSNDPLRPRQVSVLKVLQSVIDRNLDGAVDDVASNLHEPRLFRNSHHLMAFAVLYPLVHSGLELRPGIVQKAEDIMRRAEPIARQHAKLLETWKGGKARKDDDPHDLITMQAVRSLDAFRVVRKDQDTWLKHCFDGAYEDGVEVEVREDTSQTVTQILRERARSYAPRLLGYDSAGVNFLADPIELTFSISLLNRFAPLDAQHLTERAVECIARAQTDAGAWQPTRVVSYSPDKRRSLIPISSYEVALEMAHLLMRKVEEGDLHLCELIHPICRRAFALVRSTYNEVGQMSGWANDPAPPDRVVESLATSVVLTFLIHYRDALLEFRQRLILADYGVQSPDPLMRELAREDGRAVNLLWPDMKPTFRGGTEIDCSPIMKIEDLTPEGKMVDDLKEMIVTPIAEDWTRRPKTRSLILYGDPGTGKTSLAERLAETLEWPMVTLSPANFLRRRGLDGFEEAASDIFSDLLRLRRAVVLFDECEDFFKKRPDMTDQRLEIRTSGAFITAAMLPRLQALRDRGWVLFILATNSRLEDLDDAVRRRGRFDRSQEISHPTLAAQQRFVENYIRKDTGKHLRGETKKALIAVLAEHDRLRTESKNAVPQITRWVLHGIVASAVSAETLDDTTEIGPHLKGVLDKLVVQTHPQSLRDRSLP